MIITGDCQDKHGRGEIRMTAHGSRNRNEGGGWKVVLWKIKQNLMRLTHSSPARFCMSACVSLCGFGLQPQREGSDMKCGGTGNGGVWY